jgi:hypothetical protein
MDKQIKEDNKKRVLSQRRKKQIQKKKKDYATLKLKNKKKNDRQ